MIAPIRTPNRRYTDEQVNARFLELMPRIKKTALIAFASYRGERRDEAVQSVLVGAFQMLKQLAENGRLDDAYATPLARYAIGRYREGRPGGVSSCSTDVMGEHCKKLGRSSVRNFGLAERIADTFQSEAAAADARYPVHRTVALRIDFFQT